MPVDDFFLDLLEVQADEDQSETHLVLFNGNSTTFIYHLHECWMIHVSHVLPFVTVLRFSGSATGQLARWTAVPSERATKMSF